MLMDRMNRRMLMRIVTISDLGSVRLRHPVRVLIEGFGAEIVATWSEVETFGTGSTGKKAVDALKKEIVSLYLELRATPDTELGKLPQHWKRVLDETVEGTV